MNKHGYAEAVFLHNIDSGNLDRMVVGAKLASPITVRSFTDLIDRLNPYNINLGTFVARAEYIIFQDSLLNPITPTAFETFLGSVFSSGMRSNFGMFDSNYTYTPLLSDEIHDIVTSQDMPEAFK